MLKSFCNLIIINKLSHILVRHSANDDQNHLNLTTIPITIIALIVMSSQSFDDNHCADRTDRDDSN